jgi:hypothetical protein
MLPTGQVSAIKHENREKNRDGSKWHEKTRSETFHSSAAILLVGASAARRNAFEDIASGGISPDWRAQITRRSHD